MSQVSIIIPCFNAGRLLLEAVESALAQTYPDLEVIVVDDGSTDDETRLALAELKHNTNVTVIRQENRGASAARNAGISAASGMYIMPLDADDLIEPNYVKQAVPVLTTHNDVGLVYCRADFFGDQSGPWGLAEFSWSQVLVHNMVFCTALYRQEDWLAVGGYDESMVSGREDHDFVLRILGLGRRVHRLDEVLFHYRQHGFTKNFAIGQSRANLIEASAKILRNNTKIYVEHAEDLFQFIFEQHDQIMDLKHRYRALERLRNKYPQVVSIAKKTRARMQGMLRQYR